MRTHFLVHVRRTLSQRSLEHVIGFVSRILPVAPLYRALEIEPDTVDGLGGKAHLVPFELAGLEELVQECALVALSVAISRHEFRQLNSVFDGQLHKFAFLQKRVHSGITWVGFRILRWSGGPCGRGLSRGLCSWV